MKIRNAICSLLLAAGLLALISSTTSANDVESIIKKVRSTYDKIKSLETHFVQVSVWSLAGEEQRSEGKLYLQEKNNYRVETDTQLIVTDGTTVWTFAKDRNQVIIDRLTESKENPLPREILLKYTKNSRKELLGETQVGGTPCYEIVFLPEDDDAFIVSTRAWISKKDWLAVKIEQEDVNENITRYELSQIKINPPLDKALFSFTIPATAEVVDLRQ